MGKKRTSESTPLVADIVSPKSKDSIAYPASSNELNAKLPVLVFSVGFCKYSKVKETALLS